MKFGMKTYASAALMILLAASCAKEELAAVPEAVEEKSVVTMTDCSVVLFDDRTVSMLEEAAGNGKVMTRSMDVNNVIDELGVVSYERVFPYAGNMKDVRGAKVFTGGTPSSTPMPSRSPRRRLP